MKPVTKKEVQNIWTHVLRRGGIGKVAAQVGQGLGGLEVCGQGGCAGGARAWGAAGVWARWLLHRWHGGGGCRRFRVLGGTGAGVAGGLGFRVYLKP